MSFKNVLGLKGSLLIGFFLLALSSTALAVPPASGNVIDDFEDGDASDWVFFGGSDAGGGGGPANDRPKEGAYYFSTGWGGQGTASGFYGGAFRNFDNAAQVPLPADPWFNVWVLNQSNATVDSYRLEITIREDLNGDGWTNGAEDSFRLDTNFASSTFNDAWTLVSAPVSSFVNLGTGGNGVFDGDLDEVVIVIAGVQGPSGSTVEVDFDLFTFTSGGPVEVDYFVIDDFESGLPSGVDFNGLPIGFYTFSDGSPVGIATTDTPPAPRPGASAGNTTIEMTGNVAAFAGYIHAFENPAVDTWVTQDWSASEGIRFWMYGQNSGTDVFMDILDNRNPGSTGDDAERFTVTFVDDFSGWRLLEFPFSSFVRKEIGNGAPNDGLGLVEMHGYAIGMLATPGELTLYFDEVALYGVAEVPDLTVSFEANNYDIPEGGTGNVLVKLNRPMNADDPAEVSVDYFTDESNATAGRDYTPTAGTLTFVNGGPSELSFPFETFDNTKYTGDKRVILRLTNPVDVEAGFITQATATIQDDESFDPLLVDDFEEYPWLWWADHGVFLDRLEIDGGDPDALPGQGPWEGVLTAVVPQAVDIDVQGRLCNNGNGVILVVLLTTDTFDATTVDHTTVTLGDASETHVDKKTGIPRRHEEDADGDGDTDLVFHFRFNETGLECDPVSTPFNGWTYDGLPITADDEGASFGRDFALGRDWSPYEGVTFWFYGQNTGDVITVDLLDSRAPDPGPDGWTLAWSDEFDEPAGTPPDPATWVYEIGDGALNGIPGWGNEELQYYTDSTDNVATDGLGNLVITTAEANGSLVCYYGPCEYTSARLITQNRQEFAYGRIEARILLPDGAAGLWPAFWSLGTDIGVVGWPQTGEIDFMEYVSRLPNETFGTIHGPGYAGGQSFGDIYDFGPDNAYDDFHVFSVEWGPDLIEWYVDDVLYHTAEPADVAPNEWVFNDPIFMLLNQAVGGNFGGAVSPDLVFPQFLVVDYVRVFQGPDTAERWEATFTDDFAGWQEVFIPFDAFSRSAEQPDGAPDDGLGLNEVWGYGFSLPDGGSTSGYLMLDQVRLEEPPPLLAVTVVNLNDSGEGSLREALDIIADGGTVSFDPALAGGTITLTSGQLTIDSLVTVDASAAPGLTISGGNVSRVFEVTSGTVASINDLVITGGAGAPQGGGVLNRGDLSLERVVVTNNTETSAGPANFELGGGGIYNGMDATLNLVDSTVSNNASLNQPGGGIYGFFGSTINITRSTVSGNVSGDVAGGLRSLGNADVVNSTFSGNVSTVWHGGGIFHTDGQLTVTHSTFAENVAPAGTASGILVATFGAPANMTLTNSVVKGNAGATACAIYYGGGVATITSGGGNIDSDNSCNLVAAGDQPATDPLLGPLADNGGGTQTHALSAGSPAVDAAGAGSCTATDQRGVTRPQGGGCDVGSFERE